MKNLLLLALLFSPLAVSATPRQYEVSLELSRNGKELMRPRIALNEGVKGEISETDADHKNGNFIEVVATQYGPEKNKQVSLLFRTGKIKNGEKIDLENMQIIALENEKASISLGGEPGMPADVAVSAVVSRATN